MTKLDVVQSNFLSGVLDPRAIGRIDTQAYNEGLLVGNNIEISHLGGFRRRRGLAYVDTLFNQLSPIGSGAITYPEGGSFGSTGMTTTTNVGTIAPYVVCVCDLQGVQNVAWVDITSISCSGGSSVDFALQYSNDNATWTNAGPTLQGVLTQAASYRRPGVAARYWRVARVNTTADMGAATISLGALTFWGDSGTESAGRLFAFEASTAEQYQVVFSDRMATIYINDQVTDRVAMPFLSADLPSVSAAAFAETMVIVHPNYPPVFLVRQTQTWFRQFTAVFNSLPQIDYDDALSPASTPDIQDIYFSGTWKPGDQFQISLETDNSAVIAYSDDPTTLANNIASAVQLMWVIDGYSGVAVTNVGGAYRVTCSGESADTYDVMAVIPFSSAGSATVTHVQTGVARKEDAWSATRGYPVAVEFFQGRLYFGGLRSKPTSIVGSQVNNILTFAIGQGLADDPIFTTLNGRALDSIAGMFAGRSFQVFTSGGEYRYINDNGEPVTPTNAPANQTQYGSAPIKPVGIDGVTIYVQRNRKSIRDFRYDYTEGAYNSLGVSAICSHLIYDVQDMAAYNGSTIDDNNYVFVVNGTNSPKNINYDNSVSPDGTLAVLNTRREAGVQAWTSWQTQGEFASVAVVLETIYFLVRRTINGVEKTFIERADTDYYTDCAVQVTNSTPTATITGLDHLNGQECRVVADGFVLPNVTPVNGSVTLSQACRDVEIGLDWTPTAIPMPLQTMAPHGGALMRRSTFVSKRRVVSAKVKVRNTLGLLINGAVIPDTAFDLNNFDTPAAPYTGVYKLDDTSDWDFDQDKLVIITQTNPLPLEVLAIDVELDGN